MPLSRVQIVIIGAIGLVVLIFVGVFIFGTREKREKPPEVELTVWGIDDQRVFFESFANYRGLRPNVRVEYREINPDTYETELLNALAAGRGPDVFMFKNNWLPKHFDKIVPVPSGAPFGLANLQQLFPLVVEQDFAPDGIVFALPLHIDTLALYYNTDIFNTAAVAFPPADWLTFQNLISKLRQLDRQGNLVRPAAAIGGTLKSMDVAADFLSLLMIQAGAKMTDDQFTQATFSRQAEGVIPGEIALDFYTKFADPASTFYTWNDNFGDAVEEFSQGRVAMMFNYLHQKENVQAKNPFLKFRIAAMPQPSVAETAVNYPTYWGLAVSNKSASPDWAWDLIVYLTTDPATAESYLAGSGRPPALRSVIQKHLNDPELGIFAKQALTARSWPIADEKAVAEALSRMIEAVTSKQLQVEVALRQGERTISDLIGAIR